MTIALALILHPDGKRVLIARRAANAHLGGLWEFPGGKCLDGESLEDCARRETLEEVGLQVEITDAWPVVTHVYADRTVTLHPFLCAARGHDNTPANVRWVDIAQLNEYEFPPANAPLLACLHEL